MPVVAPVLVPALVAGVCFSIAWRVWRRKRLAEHAHWGGALAFGLGYISGHVTLLSWPALPPAKAMDWLPYMAGLLAVLGVAQRYWGVRWYARWPVRAGASALVSAILLRGYLEHTWERTEGLVWIGGLTAAMVALWDTLERLSSKRTGASLPLSLWLICAAASGAFVMTGSASLSQLAGSVAAVCGAAVVLAWWAPGLSLQGGALAVFAPVYAGLLMQAYFYSQLPLESAVCLYAAPFVLWSGEQRRIHFMKPWKAAIVRLLILALPLVIALGLAWGVMAETPVDTYNY